MLAEYWPFWLGAIALTLVSLGFLFVTRASLGVSGSLARVVFFRESREKERLEDAMPDDADALAALLMAATLEEFGEGEPNDEAGHEDAEPAPAVPSMVAPRRAPVSAHATFLIALALGGLLSALASGTFSLRFAPGPDFVRQFGDGPLAYVALIGGGIMVGFGTAMAGGCTSGHGLSGCSRLQRGSLAATAIFFGAGTLVSLALGALAR